MKLKNYLTFLLTLVKINSLNNLINDQGFELFSVNLTSTFSGTQDYSYRIMGNGQSDWYSLISGGIVVRQKTNMNTTVIDTVNNNTHEKICRDFAITDSNPYELSFDYLIDNNRGWAMLAIEFNGESLFYGYVVNKISITRTYIVYLTQSINTLCFEGWAAGGQNEKIGALIDNVVVAPIDVRYIHFNALASNQQLNIIYLNSNQTVANDAELTLFNNKIIMQISNLQFNIIKIDKNQNNKLVIGIQIQKQYASSQTQPIIILPEHRNTQDELIIYYVSASKLPRYLYSSSSDNQIISDSYFYLMILARIFNVIFRVIKVVAFTFVGVRFMGGFYLLLFLGLLDLEFLMPIARDVIKQFMLLTINTQTFNYFVILSGHKPFNYGVNYIPIKQQFQLRNSTGVEYSTLNITPVAYNLMIDDLFIAILNTGKILILYYIVFKQSSKFIKVLRRIKNQKIFIQYITILSVVSLITGIFFKGLALVNVYGRLNRGISIFLTFISIFLCLVVFISQYNMMIRQYNQAQKKNKKKLQKNLKYKKYYMSQIFLTLVENLMFIIVPALVGLSYTYLTLSLFLFLIILKIKFLLKSLKNNQNLLNFFWLISYLIQFSLVSFYLIAKLIQSFTNLSPSSQITWMSLLKHSSIGMIFMYIGVGFIQIVCSIYKFIIGLMSLQYSCPFRNNKVQNQLPNQNQIKVQQIQNGQFLQNSGIKVINQLKDKVERANSMKSIQKIQNPFLKSSESISITTEQQKQNKNPLQLKEQKDPKIKVTKVVTLKHIEPVEQKDLQMQRIKSKSFYIQENSGKVKKDKKPLKLIRKLQISPIKKQEGNEQFPDTLKNMVVSNFEKQENFS